MKRIILMLTVAALMVAALTITSAGAFAAKSCDPANPGCKTEEGEKKHSGNSSADFETQTTETQRGNVNAKGTQDTEIKATTCTGPSGNELRADHPQCS